MKFFELGGNAIQTYRTSRSANMAHNSAHLVVASILKPDQNSPPKASPLLSTQTTPVGCTLVPSVEFCMLARTASITGRTRRFSVRHQPNALVLSECWWLCSAYSAALLVCVEINQHNMHETSNNRQQCKATCFLLLRAPTQCVVKTYCPTII